MLDAVFSKCLSSNRRLLKDLLTSQKILWIQTDSEKSHFLAAKGIKIMGELVGGTASWDVVTAPARTDKGEGKFEATKSVSGRSRAGGRSMGSFVHSPHLLVLHWPTESHAKSSTQKPTSPSLPPPLVPDRES